MSEDNKDLNTDPYKITADEQKEHRTGKMVDTMPVDAYTNANTLGDQFQKYEDKATAGRDDAMLAEARTGASMLDDREKSIHIQLRGVHYAQAKDWLADTLKQYVGDTNCPKQINARVLTYVNDAVAMNPDATLALETGPDNQQITNAQGKILTKANGYLSQEEIMEAQSALYFEAALSQNVDLMQEIQEKDGGQLIRKAFELSDAVDGIIFTPGTLEDLSDML